MKSQGKSFVSYQLTCLTLLPLQIHQYQNVQTSLSFALLCLLPVHHVNPKRNQTNNALDHAELIAIKKACKKLNTWILEDASIYITLEPCLMCSGAILQSRIKNLYFGAYEPKFGAAGSIINVFEEEKFNHHVNVQGGILEKECSDILKSFFQNMRVDKKNKK